LTTQTSADDTLRLIAAGFGLRTTGADKAELIQRLGQLLTDNIRSGRRSLLIVDEAQNLTVPAIEELRMLSNMIVDHAPPLQCFLLGQPQFRAMMGLPALEQLRQRVLASYHLGPLSQAETRSYIEHRLSLVGWSGDPAFPDDAFAQIFLATGGLPREINSLCSRLLLYGVIEESHLIDGRTVAEVAQEWKSEFGPVAGQAVAADGESAPGVEFRLLDQRVARIEERLTEQSKMIGRALEIILARTESDPS
jgi:type II secretory pathway predicted ATPase ExeA